MEDKSFFEFDEAWRLANSLEAMDPALEAFAQAHQLSLSRNSKGVPERSLSWGNSPSCLIQIFLENLTNPTWTFWISCIDDRGNHRYSRSQYLLKNAQLADLERELPTLLNVGLAKLNDWRNLPDQLSFATRLSPL